MSGVNEETGGVSVSVALRLLYCFVSTASEKFVVGSTLPRTLISCDGKKVEERQKKHRKSAGKAWLDTKIRNPPLFLYKKSLKSMVCCCVKITPWMFVLHACQGTSRTGVKPDPGKNRRRNNGRPVIPVGTVLPPMVRK